MPIHNRGSRILLISTQISAVNPLYTFHALLAMGCENTFWKFAQGIPANAANLHMPQGLSSARALPRGRHAKKINANRLLRRGSRSITKSYAPQHKVVGNNAFLTERVVPEYGRSPDLKLQA
jgi:hypothetical protein